MFVRLNSFSLLALLCALTTACSRPISVGDKGNAQDVQLNGAGSTFAAPLYTKWIEEYQASHSGVHIRYDAVGSGKGEEQFIAGDVDFGASDAALRDDQIAKISGGAQLVPVAAGSIVLAYNVEGVENGLKLPRDVYVDIFRGKIMAWDDTRIAAKNPNVRLPSLPIVVVTRVDTSGTTYAFTNHLGAVSREWKDGPGVGKGIQWPTKGFSAPGNDGVAGLVKQTNGAIGYVEYGTAKRAELHMAALENRAGQFISPSESSGLATLLHADFPENFRVFFPDPEGKDSYPIVTYTWLLLNKSPSDPKKSAAVKNFVVWCLTEGQQFNESLGYLRLAPGTDVRIQKAVEALP